MREALARFLRALGHPGAGLSLLFAGDDRLRDLNFKYRGKELPTDVLSWRYGEAGGGAGLLGELAVSLDRARAQARENGWDLRTEVLRLMAHGCAHLAGYDHETATEEREMKAVETGLLAAVGLREIYPDEGKAPRGP